MIREHATAYPLTWPIGRPRTPSDKRTGSRFHKRTRENLNGYSLRRSPITIATGRDELVDELRRLGASGVIISTNIELKNDGLPYSNRKPPDDPGAAVYFTLFGRKMCFACDRWLSVGENLQAIAKTIEALRGIERWGTGEMVQAAFTGFAALPAPQTPDPPWWFTLGVDRAASLSECETAYKRKAMESHPDRGGNHDDMVRVNNAIEAARKEKDARGD